jgi:hypothetical protein
VKEADADGEDLVEAALAEVEVLERRDEESALPAATCSAFRRLAASIILAERSTAVRNPPSSRSHTSVAATPWPHPISSTRSFGWISRLATIDRSRSLTR